MSFDLLLQSDSVYVATQKVGDQRICIVHDGSENALSREEQLPSVELPCDEGWYIYYFFVCAHYSLCQPDSFVQCILALVYLLYIHLTVSYLLLFLAIVLFLMVRCV